MKVFISVFCAFLLIGCSDPDTTTSSESVKVEVQNSILTVPEENVSTQSAVTETVVTSTNEDGKTLYGQKCASCHGINGEKAALNKSQIIAQFNEAQVKEALKGYQNGTYGKDMKALMQGQAKGLNDAQIDALGKYISTL